MIAHISQGFLSRISWNKLVPKKLLSDKIFYEEIMSLWLTEETCSPDTKVGVQVLQNKIQNTSSSLFQQITPKILKHAKSTMIQIKGIYKTHDYL